MRPSPTSDENPPISWSVSQDLRNVRPWSRVGEACAPQGPPGEVVAQHGTAPGAPQARCTEQGHASFLLLLLKLPCFILIAAWAVDDEDDRALCVEVAWSPSAALGVRSGAPKHVWTLDHVQVLFPSLRWQGRKSSRSQRAVREGIRITSGPNKSLNRFVGLSQNSFGVGGGCVLSNSGV